MILEGDCIEIMAGLDEDSIDAIVTDPPYGLKFMGKGWDDMGSGSAQQAWHARWAKEALRVLKPGGHIVAFGGTRTVHRLTSALEDAGFEIRDSLVWLYGTGFPKSHNVSKAIDKQRHNRPQLLQVTAWIRSARDAAEVTNRDIDLAFGFNGMSGHWTTAKSQPAIPTLEQVPTLLEVLGNPEVPEGIAELLITLNGSKGQPGAAWFRREVIGSDKKRADNGPVYGDYAREWDLTLSATDNARRWEGYGTALKPAMEPIVLARKPFEGTVAANVLEHGAGALHVDACRIPTTDDLSNHSRGAESAVSKGALGDSAAQETHQTVGQKLGRFPANVLLDPEAAALLDEQSDNASRFFYGAKASNGERWGWCEACNCAINRKRDAKAHKSHEVTWHPTVKPVALMRWLVRLIGGQPGSVILDPFAGTGTTGEAAEAEGFEFVGIEKDGAYVQICRTRVQG